MSTVVVTDKNRARVLAALYNHARPQGLGFLDYSSQYMTEKGAQEILDRVKSYYYFDYLMGRVMKVDLKGPSIDFWLYDRDNGNGAGESVTKDIK